MNPIKKSFKYGNHTVTMETGEIARQADGAVLVNMSDTVVLATVVAQKQADPAKDFLPLTVNYVEKTYAAGRIPGGFFKREGRPTEKETLTSRLIDRPLRPLFPKGWHYETQLVAMPMSVDGVHPYDILAMNGASAALAISPVPVAKHVGAVRIGKLDGDFVINPPEETHEELDLDLIVAGTDEAILMVEAGAQGVTEAEILDALDIAHGEIKKLVASGLPTFGICLGHQMLGIAVGARTHKMHQGHHGANHPVKDYTTNKVEIVSMNHGFAVDRETLPQGVEETHVSLFDGTNCGIRLKDKPVFSVQYHPEASPGPMDSHYLFARFRELMERNA